MAGKPEKILVVDDTPTNLTLVRQVFQNEPYDLTLAESGIEAMEIIAKEKFDLILLDVMMPKIDGFKVCQHLKYLEKTKDIPVIFLTAMSHMEEIRKGFEVGGVDYIVKPFNPVELKMRVKTHLELKRYRESEVEQTQKEIVFTLAYVGELRSQDTGNHVKRVSEYSGLLGKLYGLNDEAVEMLKLASAMHDIGKVAIPDRILNKPDRLDSKERNIMKEHSRWGEHIFARSKRPILKAAAIVAGQHHEKYDGTGYPRGLKGEQIHLFGRIVSITDVFDALITKRAYKQEWKMNQVLAYITEESGRHFDPKLVDLFIDNFGQFMDIHQRLKD